MKTTYRTFLMLLTPLLLASCSTVKQAGDPKSDPETVLITYHVKPGKESEMQAVLRKAWAVYQDNRLVVAQPHVVVSEKEGGDKIRVVEVFTWVSHSAPDHAPDDVRRVFNQLQALCEARDGHNGLDGGEVELWQPSAR